MVKQNIPFASLDTPAILLDMDKLEANIREMSQLAADARVRLRPHTKVHESPFIAKLQIEAGACGIEVGTVDRAEFMADEGIDDIIIAHPFYGGHKLESLRRLLTKPGLRVTVIVDMIEQAERISEVGQSVSKKVPVLLKIAGVDTRSNRFGVRSGEPALNLAKRLCQLPGIQFVGIYAHEMGVEPTPEGADKHAFEVASMMAETAKMLRRAGITIKHVSVGASPTFRATCRYIKEKQFPEITEIHPGQCVIGDIWHIMSLGNRREACAATVLTTVVSTSHPGHAVVDAGYKTFGADSIIAFRKRPGFFWEERASFGFIQGRPDLWLGCLAAETACVYYMDSKKKLSLGERLQIVPNNATLVISIQDKIYGVRNGGVVSTISVTGRGHAN